MKSLTTLMVTPVAAAVLLLAGCAAPAFKQPDVAVPAAFKEIGNQSIHVAADGTR